jgi:DNA-binding NarL/FixJ family response regulator
MEVCDRVMNGEFVYPDDTPMIRIGYSNSNEFTGREFDIIRELAQGRKYEEIAADLDITPNTVKYHIKNILQKTGYQNTLQLVAEVVEKRLILPKY